MAENFDILKSLGSLLAGDVLVAQRGKHKGKVVYSDLAAQVVAAAAAAKALAVTTAWVDGEDGTGVATLTFTLGGEALAEPLSGFFYVSEAADGLAAASLDTGATAGAGVIAPILSAATSHYHFITDATGVLELTLTSNADSYWIVFQQNDGTLLISDELAITGP